MRVRGGPFVIAALARPFEDGKANLTNCCRPKPRRRTAVWCSRLNRKAAADGQEQVIRELRWAAEAAGAGGADACGSFCQW
jgi:hypothetical protein